MEKKILYLECESGISGDMTVAALLDLGADQEILDRALKSLPADGFRIVVSRVKKVGLDVCDFDVVLDAAHQNHDHDMEYLHGHKEIHDHMHTGSDSHEDTHVHANNSHGETHSHVHAHGSHVHEQRGLPEILHMIGHADMTERAKKTASRIFEILAEAEAKAHGVPKEQVHFHEVGAVDSIVDIIAVAVCLDDLGITDVVVPKLNEGQGTVRCQHGILPVPVPAVMNIVKAHGLPLHITAVQGELVTPTGAAVVAAIRTSSRLPEVFTVKKTGMGAGKRDYDCPGIVRAMLIEDQSEDKDPIHKLETNVDD